MRHRAVARLGRIAGHRYSAALNAPEKAQTRRTDAIGQTRMMTTNQARIAKLDVKIAGLYAEVDRLDDVRRSVKGHDTNRAYMLDVQSQSLREQARALDRELDMLRRAKPS